MGEVIYIGDTIYQHLTIFDSDGVTPLSGEEYTDFSIVYVINSGINLFALTSENIVEIGTTGTYVLVITPNTVGNHYIRIKGTNDVYGAWKEFRFTVKSATSGTNIVEKVLTNKMTIELQGNYYYQIVYADDGETELIKWKLYTLANGVPTIGDSGPASRGVPES